MPQEPVIKLLGWDDGQLYFWDGKRDYCINDHPELFARMVKMCEEYFSALSEAADDHNLPPPTSDI